MNDIPAENWEKAFGKKIIVMKPRSIGLSQMMAKQLEEEGYTIIQQGEEHKEMTNEC